MGGGNESQQTTQSQSVTQLPPWVNQAAQQNYAYAQNVAGQPLQQYQGQQVADVGAQMQQAWNTAAQGTNAGQDQYNAANAGYLGVLGQTPLTVNPTTISAGGPTMKVNAGGPTMQVRDPGNAAAITAGQLSSTNLSPYMNPYTQDVINKTLPIMQQNLALSQNQQQNQANAANAFGGSRQAIQQGVTQAQGAMGMAQMAAQLNQSNFAQAQQQAQTDIASRLTASQANQQNQQTNLARAMQAQQLNQAANAADLTRSLTAQQSNQAANAADLQRALTAAQSNQSTNLTGQQLNQAAQQNQGNLNLTAAAGLGSLGQQAQLNQARNFTEQTTAGAEEQQQAQNQINAQIAKFQEARAYPGQQLGVLQSALGMTPYGQAQQGQSTTTSQSAPNMMMTALGGLTSLASLFGGGGMGGLGGLLGGSDRAMKTDIAKLGMHPAGVPMYAYRYKGDPKTFPKVVGPMAEDVMKIAPHAVARIPGTGGKMAVHMGALNALAPPSRRPSLAPPPTFAPRGGLGPPGVAPPGFGMGPPVPGPLAAPGVAGGVGALGAAMRGAPRGPRPRIRPPPIRGALGG
jgi:hypothetical protein